MEQIQTIRSTASRGRAIAYWTTTGFVAFAMISGGAAELLGAPQTISGIMALGYPAYFAKLIGFWKLLGGVALVVPRWPALKEWAYAGIFFNMTGAAVSNTVAGAASWHVVVNIIFVLLLVASRALWRHR